jgi:UDP-galactopyranose mutase
MVKTLVIGAGFAGCTVSQMLAEKSDHEVTLIERQSYLGGGCKTFYYGGHPYTLGPRHFLTKKEAVFEYLNKMCPMKLYEGHRFLTYVEGDQSFYHFPIHMDEVREMPDAEKILEELKNCAGAEGAKNLEEYWLRSVGDTLYHKYVEKYSRKMWGIESNTEITDFGFTPKGVALKTEKSRAAWTEAIAGFPKAFNGYDDFFDRATEHVTVRLNTNIEAFDMERHRVQVEGAWESYDMIISTVSPEIILNNAFGELRWAGRDFFKIVMPTESVFPDGVYFLYYANNEPFTRMVEYKKFYDYQSPTTLLGLEMPSNKNKLYPFPMKKDQDLHQKYMEAMPERVYSIGRMGTYRYLDIGMIIDQCMELTSEL